MNKEKVGAFIAECRKEKNLTQEELGEKLGIGSRSVSKWERGLSFPSSEICPKLCSILGISVNELFAGERISAENITVKSDENITAAVKETEKIKRIVKNCFIGFVLLLCIIGINSFLDAESKAFSDAVNSLNSQSTDYISIEMFTETGSDIWIRNPEIIDTIGEYLSKVKNNGATIQTTSSGYSSEEKIILLRYAFKTNLFEFYLSPESIDRSVIASRGNWPFNRDWMKISIRNCQELYMYLTDLLETYHPSTNKEDCLFCVYTDGNASASKDTRCNVLSPHLCLKSFSYLNVNSVKLSVSYPKELERITGVKSDTMCITEMPSEGTMQYVYPPFTALECTEEDFKELCSSSDEALYAEISINLDNQYGYTFPVQIIFGTQEEFNEYREEFR